MDLPRAWHAPDAGPPPPPLPQAAHAIAVSALVLCVLIIVLSTSATWVPDSNHPERRRREYVWGPVPVLLLVVSIYFLYDDQVLRRRRVERLSRTWYAPADAS